MEKKILFERDIKNEHLKDEKKTIKHQHNNIGKLESN